MDAFERIVHDLFAPVADVLHVDDVWAVVAGLCAALLVLMLVVFIVDKLRIHHLKALLREKDERISDLGALVHMRVGAEHTGDGVRGDAAWTGPGAADGFDAAWASSNSEFERRAREGRAFEADDPGATRVLGDALLPERERSGGVEPSGQDSRQPAGHDGEAAAAEGQQLSERLLSGRIPKV